MSLLPKVAIFIKRVISSKIFIFIDSVIPDYQLIEKMKISLKEPFLVRGLFAADSLLENVINSIGAEPPRYEFD